MADFTLDVTCKDLPIVQKLIGYLGEAMENPFDFHDEGREYNTCRWCGSTIVFPCSSRHGDANSHTEGCLITRMRADGLL